MSDEIATEIGADDWYKPLSLCEMAHMAIECGAKWNAILGAFGRYYGWEFCSVSENAPWSWRVLVPRAHLSQVRELVREIVPVIWQLEVVACE